MRWMRISMWTIAFLAALGLGGTFLVEASFLGRAQLVQPITRDSSAETGWRLVGGPVYLLNVPPNVLVTQSSLGIPAQADVARLATSKETISLEPIRQTIAAARWGALIAIVMMAAGLIGLKRLCVTPLD